MTSAQSKELKAMRMILTGVLLLIAVGLYCHLSTSSAQASFGITEFDGEVRSIEAGAHATQAGSHPYDAETTFLMNTAFDSRGNLVPDGGQFKDAVVDLPPGFVGNPNATATKCTTPELTSGPVGDLPACPASSQIGIVRILSGIFGNQIGVLQSFFTNTPVYNMRPPRGVPAMFGFAIGGAPVLIEAQVRTGGDYGVTLAARNAPQALRTLGTEFTVWGVPSDPSHDALRVCPTPTVPVQGCATDARRLPLLTLPTNCAAGPLTTTLKVDSWFNPGLFESASFDHDVNGEPMSVEGCEKPPFKPGIAFAPSATNADSPTGLDVRLTLPQNDNPDGIATSHLKRASVTLPEGMSVNPSSAAGLGGCSSAQIDIDGSRPDECPDTSKIGTVSIETPLLDHTVHGSVYLASQNDNPFNSLLALYIAVDDEESGVVIKLAGEVAPDPGTGQLVATFDENPQLPFSSFDLNFFGGPKAPLITPSRCGTYEITSELSSWSAADPDNPTPEEIVTETSTFKITQGPNGTPCPSPGQFDPAFEAGTLTPIAGAFSPLIVIASRPDGSQPLTGINLKLPEGLTGKLAGVPYCSESGIAAAIARNQSGQGALELSSPSCPAASQVGTVDVAAGAGPTPFHVQGKAYLAGPYKGAPLSLVVITPAMAGPFDLGVVAVRAALRVDPSTAQITAESDPIPQILHGIPLKIRSVSVDTNRPEFTLNPTDCEPFALSGTLFGASTSKPVSNRFQVGACKALDFAPKLSLQFSGAPTHRGGHPKLKAVLTARKGDANIGRAVVTLPKTELLENAHIGTICTRPQYAADACPAKSVYGYAKAWTPLLDKPLQGPVYLRANGGERDLPDLVAKLDGQIHFDLVGYIDSVNARIRNTFALVPDAPVSKFELTMKGGPKGLLVHNTNICRTTPRAEVKFIGQNGKVQQINPAVKTGCGK